MNGSLLPYRNCSCPEIRFKCILLVLSVFLMGASVFANEYKSTTSFPDSIQPIPYSISDESEKRGAPSTSVVWKKPFVIHPDGSCNFSVQSPTPFSFFGIGWLTRPSTRNAGISIRYRTRSEQGYWSEWIEIKAESIDESPIGLLNWSDICFVADSIAHRICEISIIPAPGTELDLVRIDFVDMRSSGNEMFQMNLRRDSLNSRVDQGCTLPAIIGRSEWCGSDHDCTEPAYSPVNIQPTHVVIHHGGSPDTYSDGYTVVRSYWNYHVHSLGWDDIGYNYLIDKEGNLFHGRYNNDLSSDVKGAHAGNSNGHSIGICFPGNSDKTKPTEPQLRCLEQFLSWWFNSRGFDPTSKASLIDQAGAKMLYLPHIIGHRDLKETVCPGNELYGLLPAIGANTKTKLIDCSQLRPHLDLSLLEATLFNHSVTAGDNLRLTFTHSISGQTENDNGTIVGLDFWLSADPTFNPNEDLFLMSENDTIYNNSAFKYKSCSLTLDSSTTAGNYHLIVLTDLNNTIYETDECNNELSVPLSVDALQIEIAARPNSSKSGQVSGAGKQPFGQSCTVSATPFYGYRFSHWTANGLTVSDSSSYSFKVKKALELVAWFVCDSEARPVPILGDTTICNDQKNVSYSLPFIPDANCKWSLPAGSTGTEGDHSIMVDFSTEAISGEISVVVTNECFDHVTSILPVRIVPAPDPPVIARFNGVLRSTVPQGNQWFCDNEPIKNENGFTFIPSSAGSYYTIIIREGCTSQPSNLIAFDPEADDNNPLIIFPNPTNGLVELFFKEALTGTSRIQVFNPLGERIETLTKLNRLKYLTIDLSKQQKGVYVIAISSRHKTFSGKVMLD